MASPPKSEPVKFALSHDAWGHLVLVDATGARHVGVEPVRAFPISDPERWISICSAEGHELVSIDDLASLDEEVRAVLIQDLARHEFVPVVERIMSLTDADPSQWEVQTDRGPTTFLVNSEEDFRRLGPHKVMVIDAQGIRYLIPDSRKLDASSRRSLERYL